MKKSYTGRPVFMIVRSAEHMTLRAQNRLLKTLEEPPSGVKILLLTENAELLAPTIRSRCILFRLASSSEGETLFSAEEREKALRFACDILEGKPFYAFSGQIAGFASSRETAEQWISCAETFFRDVLVSFYDHSGRLLIHREEIPLIRRCAASFSAEQMAEAAVCAEKALRDLAFNVSPGRAIKYMIFDLQEKLRG